MSAMTFSIVAFDPVNGDLGVAVQSKFPNVGVTIPFARAGTAALATECYCNWSYAPRGFALVVSGATPQQAIDILTANDAKRDYRQVGIVDTRGRAASFTGVRCFDWASSLTGENFAVQGNVLAGQQVVEALAATLLATPGPLAERLLAALAAGQAAGGDRRGQQSAALLVVRKGGGYGGNDDRYVDISVYDHPTPIQELYRLYAIHRLTFLRSDPANLVPIDEVLGRELQQLLQVRGFYQGSVTGLFDTATKQALQDFMGWENYDERIREDDLLDLEVLEDIRRKHAVWLQRQSQ